MPKQCTYSYNKLINLNIKRMPPKELESSRVAGYKLLVLPVFDLTWETNPSRADINSTFISI